MDNNKLMDFLTCNKCNLILPKESFNKNINYIERNGYYIYCKTCRHNQENNYKLNQKGLQNVNKVLGDRVSSMKYRAKQKGMSCNITKNDVVHLYHKQNGKCALSGVILTFYAYSKRVNTNISLDRIDSNKGYEKGNLQLTCMAVNQMKNNLSVQELILLCKKILLYNNDLNFNNKLDTNFFSNEIIEIENTVLKEKNYCKGELVKISKITENIARSIKIDIKNKVKRKETLSKYNITVGIYKGIQNNKTWTWVTID
jgi:hypothetical protein